MNIPEHFLENENVQYNSDHPSDSKPPLSGIPFPKLYSRPRGSEPVNSAYTRDLISSFPSPYQTSTNFLGCPQHPQNVCWSSSAEQILLEAVY
jgi:hypothetical protein